MTNQRHHTHVICDVTHTHDTQLLHEIDTASLALPGPRFEMDKSFREYQPLKTCVLQVWIRFNSCAAVTATHCNTLQCTARHCNTLQHIATHCNTLQHTATDCIIRSRFCSLCPEVQHTATHCSTSQHTATDCNTLQHTAT